MNTDELHYSGVTEEEAEFIQTNVGVIGRQEIARLLCIADSRVIRAIKKMGLQGIRQRSLPEGLELGYLPLNTIRYQTARGFGTQTPCGTPGIKSRTFYTQMREQDGKDSAFDQPGELDANSANGNPARAVAPSGPIKVPHKKTARPARAASKKNRPIGTSRAVQKVPGKHAAVERI